MKIRFALLASLVALVPVIASADRPNNLLIGGGVGIPPMIFLAEHLKNASNLLMMQSKKYYLTTHPDLITNIIT